jgi:hypothetical protein
MLPTAPTVLPTAVSPTFAPRPTGVEFSVCTAGEDKQPPILVVLIWVKVWAAVDAG